MSVVASVTVTVQSGTATGKQYEVSAEVYQKNEDGTYESASQFEPGETAYIALFKSEDLSVATSVASAGSLSPSGQYTFTEREDLVFSTIAATKTADTKYNEASVGKPVASYSFYWYTSSINTVLLEDKKTFRSQQFNIAVASCQYTTNAAMYRLDIPAAFPDNPHLDPDEQAYPIIVIFVCTPPTS